MGHQYPVGPRQYQTQRDFLNDNNNNNNSTFSDAAATDRQIYFDPAQSRPSPRVVQRRLPLYQQQAPQTQQVQQRSSIAYPTRGAQLLHVPPPSVISNRAYSDLYEQRYAAAYEQQQYIPATSYQQHLTLDQGMQQQQQHVDVPSGYQYEYDDEQLYLQDSGLQDEHLSEAYQPQECFVDQQQEPLRDYVSDETYARVGTYYEGPMALPTNRQFIARQQQQRQNFHVVDQRHFDGMSMQTARRRLSAPLHHFHHQMDNMHHISHQQSHHHLQQQQLQQQHQHHQQRIQQLRQHHHQQEQQHNPALANSEYFDPRRARASLSDGQEHQQHDSRLLRQPMQSVMLQNPSRLAPQTYYARTNAERYDATQAAHDAALSASSLDFIPPPNLPLRNRQDMNTNNGSLAATAMGLDGASSIYVPADETLGGQGTSPVEVPAEMNIPFESQPYNSQQSIPSSSMLSEPTSVITPPTMAPALLVRDPPPPPPPPPETNEKPVAPMLSSEAVALARTHVDNREIDVLPYGQSDIGRFSSVYDCNSVTGTPAQPTTLQHQRQQQQLGSERSQKPQSKRQPFANANGSTLSASNGNNQEQVTNSLIKQESIDAPSPIADQSLLSSPKTNPREYLDMGTSGTVRQDWLDSICGHLIEHMNNFGICVIDNFLGSIKGELILQEVHRLYSNRRYSKGRLVSDKLNESFNDPDSTSLANGAADGSSLAADNNNSSNVKQPQQSERRLQGMAADATGAIRSDRVIWVDGCEDGCEEINNLIQTLCSVITNSSRLSVYTDNGLDKANINKRTKAHVACYPGSGTRYIKHVDNPNGDGRVITAIYYLNKNWNTKRDGGLLRMFPAGMDEVANIEPLFDRALFFWSDRRNPHEVLPSFRDRYAITVWYIGETRS